MAHKWTYEEDLICARAYIAFVLSTDSEKSEKEMIHNLTLALKSISEGSIRMKIQNFKAISKDLHFEDGVKVTSLSQYSRQSQRAYAQAVKEAVKD